ncbi:hypothetical protein BJ138DRAFT_416111 [Hygrophoropsis aurantiaca]|uniref:Uncharacterized protein n=1 Tax=Hygrophoropsis aurantiaca TaxID=72124 RepID=A0ACB8ALJ4_9AGAM|nr:hypothetical protein BJ138DRAFT_416111 [Hygrophoropsis aurantiaca]
MSTSPPPSDIIAAAVERRTQLAGDIVSAAQLAQEHEQRQMFRRLIDPGIFRPNSKETALAALKILSSLAENLLREPENPKFRQFKSTNDVIRKRLIEPKGTLEYAIALGFRPDVKDFQPFYVFNDRKVADLRIGAAILKEFIDREAQKQEYSKRNKVDEKAVAAEVAQKVKLAFMDDRKAKMLRDQIERQAREARANTSRDVAESQAEDAPASGEESPSQDHRRTRRSMPGVGYSLLSPDPEVDDPPPYNGEL